jgi:hypothetical protein
MRARTNRVCDAALDASRSSSLGRESWGGAEVVRDRCHPPIVEELRRVAEGVPTPNLVPHHPPPVGVCRGDGGEGTGRTGNWRSERGEREQRGEREWHGCWQMGAGGAGSPQQVL